MENEIKSLAEIFKKNPYEGYLRKAQMVAGKKEKALNPVHEVVNTYFEINGWTNQPKVFFEGRYSYGRLAAQAKRLLESCNGDLEDALWCLDKMKYLADKKGFSWTISTCLKHELQWGK